MTAVPLWGQPPNPLALPAGVVHLWQVALDQPAEAITLSDDEQARAARFVFERDRRRYVAARSALRAILAPYLSIRPDALRFQYNEHGKPAVPNTAVQFNLSHSHELALVAVTREAEVGVDVEHLRPVDDLAALAARNFSARENARWATVAPAQQRHAFFNAWTRKEAYLKALGSGLAVPLDEFDVSLAPDEPAALLAVRGAEDEAAHWTLHAFTPAPGYVGAVALRATGVRFQYWCWSPA